MGIDLTGILKGILGGVVAGLEQKVRDVVQGKLDVAEGRQAAVSVAHLVTKAGENAMNPATGLELEQRIRLGDALFESAALQLENAAQAARDLSHAQAALERARGTGGEGAARTAREAAEKHFRTQLRNVARAAVGEPFDTVS